MPPLRITMLRQIPLGELSADAWAWLLASAAEDDAVAHGLIARADLPTETAVGLLEANTSAAVRCALLAQHELPHEQVVAMVKGEKRVTVLRQIAEVEALSAVTLTAIAERKADDPELQQLVATHPACDATLRDACVGRLLEISSDPSNSGQRRDQARTMALELDAARTCAHVVGQGDAVLSCHALTNANDPALLGRHDAVVGKQLREHIGEGAPSYGTLQLLQRLSFLICRHVLEQREQGEQLWAEDLELGAICADQLVKGTGGYHYRCDEVAAVSRQVEQAIEAALQATTPDARLRALYSVPGLRAHPAAPAVVAQLLLEIAGAVDLSGVLNSLGWPLVRDALASDVLAQASAADVAAALVTTDSELLTNHVSHSHPDPERSLELARATLALGRDHNIAARRWAMAQLPDANRWRQLPAGALLETGSAALATECGALLARVAGFDLQLVATLESLVGDFTGLLGELVDTALVLTGHQPGDLDLPAVDTDESEAQAA